MTLHASAIPRCLQVPAVTAAACTLIRVVQGTWVAARGVLLQGFAALALAAAG
jgi:hypothetical protein